MVKNVGSVDRIVRYVIAIVALVVAWQVGFGSPLGIVLIVVAAAMAITGTIGFCALYKVFGINTCKTT